MNNSEDLEVILGPIPKIRKNALNICKSKNIKDWLDCKVNDNLIDDKYIVNESTIKPYKSKSQSVKSYYIDDDDDFYADEIDLIITTKNKKLMPYVDKFDTKHLFIPPNTNRHHCNQLFKKLIDYSYKDTFNILNKNGSYDSSRLLGPEFKSDFYDFCSDNSN